MTSTDRLMMKCSFCGKDSLLARSSWPREQLSSGVVEILSDCATDVMREKGITSFNRHIDHNPDYGYDCVVFQVDVNELRLISELNHDLAKLIVERGIAGVSEFAVFERGHAPFYITVGI